MRIIGPPSAKRDDVLYTVSSNVGRHNRFVDEMLPVLWDASLELNVDPVGVIAQSAKGTAWGNFPGAVKPWFYNTAGIKVRDVNSVMGLLGTSNFDHSLVHAQFASWEIGARAHVEHLRAYAGWPVEGQIVDPRYVWVIGKHKLENFEELGGKWAPAADYGTSLVAIARRLQG